MENHRSNLELDSEECINAVLKCVKADYLSGKLLRAEGCNVCASQVHVFAAFSIWLP